MVDDDDEEIYPEDGDEIEGEQVSEEELKNFFAKFGIEEDDDLTTDAGADDELTQSAEETSKEARRKEYEIKQATIEIKRALFAYLSKYSNFLLSFGTLMIKITRLKNINQKYSVEGETEGVTLNEIIADMIIFHKKFNDIIELQNEVIEKLNKHKNTLINGQIDLGQDFNWYCLKLKLIKNFYPNIKPILVFLNNYIKRNGSNQVTNHAKIVVTKIEEITDLYFKNNKTINDEFSSKIIIPRNRVIPQLHEMSENKEK